jgi:hypothetical protein
MPVACKLTAYRLEQGGAVDQINFGLDHVNTVLDHIFESHL